MAAWDPQARASNWWYLAGAAEGIGSIVAIIYVLVSDSKKKFFSLLYLIGILGPIIVYLVCKDDDPKLANLSKKLLIGNIVVLVVAALLALGVFGLFSAVPNNGFMGTCIGAPGFSCMDPLMGTSGLVSLALGQNTGSTLYNVELACISASNPLAYTPNSGGIYSTPLAQVSYGDNGPGFASGELIQLNNLPCYGSASLLGPVRSGTQFNGVIWMNYTTNSTPPGPGNPWLIVKVATLSVTSS